MKKRSKKGFTLMELLIVVAIISILIVISIPLFKGALEKAEQATDKANERAAKAVVVASYLAETPVTKGWFYDANQGIFVSPKGTLNYGKVTGGALELTSTYAGTGVPSLSWNTD